MQKIRNFIYIFLIFGFILSPFSTQGAELLQNETHTYKAKVLKIMSEEKTTLPGTDSPHLIQNIKAEITKGEKIGKIIEFKNDYTPLKEGRTFYLNHVIEPDGYEFYTVQDPNRLPTLLIFTIIFLVLVIAFGGIQGLRGIVSLCGSLFIIMFVLLPGILNGMPPLPLSIGVASIIIIVGSYVTHGFNKTTTSAVVGMIITVVFTGIMAFLAVENSYLTGITSDEAIFLNYNTRGGIDLMGLLMGAIMIGLLGVLYDVAISQAISVEELHKIAPHIERKKIYKRAIRIGKEHIGALVDTLAIAYVGASLPLLLLFYSAGDTSFWMIINREIFATEIIRILIGSIGIVLAVPITTYIAAVMLIKKTDKNISAEKIEAEEEALSHFHHSH